VPHEPPPESRDLPQRSFTVKYEQVRLVNITGRPIHLLQHSLNRGQINTSKSGARKEDAQRVYVISRRPSPEQASLNDGSAAPHKRVVNSLTGGSQAFYEEAGKLRLKAGPIANFVNGMGLSLSSRPKFVNQVVYAAFYLL
jgi:hypothetical protein